MRFTIYQGVDGQFYWRLKSANNKIIADSAEGYVSRRNADRAVRTLFYSINNTARLTIIQK